MPRDHRFRTPAIAGTFLIAGVAIGLAIPRTSSIVTPRSGEHDNLHRPVSRATARNVYSPDIRNDNYARQEQLKIVEMLERQCQSMEQNCQLAVAARRSVNHD